MRFNRRNNRSKLINNRRRAKYSLTENLLAEGGLGLLTEMQMSKSDIQDLTDTILALGPFSGASSQDQKALGGDAGEAWIMRHVGGQNTDDTIETNCPFVDVQVGDLSAIAKSAGGGGTGGLVFYSVKTSVQGGVIDAKQKLNIDVFADALERKGHCDPGQEDMMIRFGVYLLTIDFKSKKKQTGADSVQVYRSDLHTALVKKINGKWTCVDVQEQASNLDYGQTDAKQGFNDDSCTLIRSMGDFEKHGLEMRLVGENAFSYHDDQGVQRRDPSVHDTNPGEGGHRTRDSGFRGRNTATRSSSDPEV